MSKGIEAVINKIDSIERQCKRKFNFLIFYIIVWFVLMFLWL